MQELQQLGSRGRIARSAEALDALGSSPFCRRTRFDVILSGGRLQFCRLALGVGRARRRRTCVRRFGIRPVGEKSVDVSHLLSSRAKPSHPLSDTVAESSSSKSPPRSRCRAANRLLRLRPAVPPSLQRARESVPRCIARASSISSRKLLSAASARGGSSCWRIVSLIAPHIDVPVSSAMRSMVSIVVLPMPRGWYVDHALQRDRVVGIPRTFRYEIMSLISARS